MGSLKILFGGPSRSFRPGTPAKMLRRPKGSLKSSLENLFHAENLHAFMSFMSKTINLLHAKTSCYAQDSLLSLQSFSFIPTIDKPTRVYNNSATLIDNILTNKVDTEITSGNISSDTSDHYSQFCISHNFIQRPKPGKQNTETFLVIPGASSTLNYLMLW